MCKPGEWWSTATIEAPEAALSYRDCEAKATWGIESYLADDRVMHSSNWADRFLVVQDKARVKRRAVCKQGGGDINAGHWIP